MKHYNLTTPQKNIWNLQKYYANTSIANICGAVFYNEKRDSALLQDSIRLFIKNQSGLRLRFVEDNEPQQYVSEETVDDIPVMVFQSMDEFDGFVQKFAKEPIGLANHALYRFIVFQVGNKSGILAALSHLISDAWTFGIMVNQFDKAYYKLLDNSNDELLQGNYCDYIQSEKEYMGSPRYEKDKKYWEEKYTIRPEESPIKLAPVSSDSIAAKRIMETLPVSLERKIAAYCKNNPVTQAVLFETAVIIYLSKINMENKSITIGVPVLNRSNAREKTIAGMFISTIPLTVTLTENMTVSELAKQISKGHIDIFRHQKYPYTDILKYLREKQDFSGNLYDVMVSYQNAKTDTVSDTIWYSNGYSEVPFVLHIDNRDGKESHTINVDYQTAVFQEEEVRYIIERLKYIMMQIVEDYGRLISDISIVSEVEYEKLISEFNNTAVDYPKDKCVPELFTEQVQKTPDKTALVFEDKHFTYIQLDEMSNSLAHFLREKGVRRNDVIPIIAKRSWHVVVAMLGVLKAGGAYMLIDYQYPKERISYLVQECKSNVVLVYGCTYNALSSIDLELVDYWKNIELPAMINEFDDNLCAIHTSGSTGLPKVTLLTHGNIVHYINASAELFSGIKQSISTTIITFDAFIQETVVSLCRQVPIILLSDTQMSNQIEFESIINKFESSFLFQTPTKLLTYIKNSKSSEFLRKIKNFIIGGEVFPEELYDKIKFYNSENAIFNIYGPTETTVCATYKRVDGGNNITIGKPIANTQIYILDKNQNLLPIGVAGELCIAGDGVGRGYLNRPELTAERFLPNPFATEENGHGKVMYRTGDLACFRTDGEIEYLGRIDTQVKIRGLRIELGEIESVMSGFPGILMSTVTDKRDENKRQYLVGYYTSESPVDEKELRKYLSAKLPKYMVPNYFVRLETMPMTASGKTDRKNLPLPDFTLSQGEYVEPETEAEKKLAAIWNELLQIERVGKTEDFFELGGDSLLAITMIARVEDEFHAGISVKEVMEYSTLEQLAEVIANAKEKRNGITARCKEKYALLPQQKAIYVAYKKSPETLEYNMPAWIKLPYSIDRQRLKQCIEAVINHHRSLKTYISAENDNVYGVYDDAAKIFFEDYTNDAISDFLRPFDLKKAPLVHIGFTEDKLLFDMHHIIADGESLNIILKDILCAYAKESLSDSEIQYSDYAEYFTEIDFAPHKSFFKNILKCEFEPMRLPERKGLGIISEGASKIFFLSDAAVKGAKTFAGENGLTDTMLYLGAFGILLSKYTAKEDILTGIILSNRLHKELKNVVGMFVNTLPVCFSVKGKLKEYYKQIKDLILNLYEYQEFPFLEIAETVGMKDKSVINTSFVYQADGEKVLRLEEQELAANWMNTNTAKFDLSMEVTPIKKSCKVRLEYNCAKYDEKLINELFRVYERILEELAVSEAENIENISILSDEERHKLVSEFNDTAVDYRRDKCVHELFTEQAQKTPDKIALIFEDKQFTYRQLDEMSNSLAHFLREKGVRRNDVAPIIAKRSWHVVVAMLGVLKAGGAYMPVSPDYPEERIKSMLEIAEAKVALLYGYEKVTPTEQIDLDGFGYSDNKAPIENQNSPEDLCYVIFTSGTTGTPKGIEISHRNLVNFMGNNEKNIYQRYVVEKGKIMLASTVFTFDISMFEIYLSLLNGLEIVMVNDDEINSQHLTAALIKKYSVDILQCTPTRLAMLINNDSFKKVIQKIKVVMIGAEELTTEMYRKVAKYTSAAIFNGYGPTEITIGASFKRITEGSDITIGKPIANTQIYILDKNQNFLPIGVAGELCIAGDGVGRGYLNHPELTAERFIPNPFATEENGHGKVMYRTGDLACFRTDGEIEYLGRIDTQVKIRGLRIELGEIESVMSGFPGILMSAVTDKRDENKRQYLVGYYTSESPVDEKELRKYLSAKLPKYMVPNYFVRLETMPMTASGKTDRKNLPLPDITLSQGEYVEPETEAEKKLAVIWSELLQIERVGKTEDFFELGGDSLLAITMIARVEDEFHAGISVKEVMEHSTLEQLAEVIANAKEKRNGITARHKEKYALLPQQKAIYAACSKEAEKLLYNIPTYISLPPMVEKEKLKSCIMTVVQKHESLKTCFSVEGDEVYGIYDESAEIVFEEYSNQTISGFLRPFDLKKAPLMRIGFTEDKLLFDIHHIIADGESLSIILKDIFSAYMGEKLATSEISFSDYAAYFAEADFTAHKAFFKDMLKCELESVRLPEKRLSTETGGRSKVFLLPEKIMKGAKTFAGENGLTDTMLYLGAFGILLSKYTVKEDILTSVILTNRQHKELRNVVGMFVNTLPVYLPVKDKVKEYYKRVKELVLNLYEYQELPFLEIAEAVGMKEKNIINTSFVYQAGGEKALEIEGVKLLPEFVETKTAKFDLSMEVTPINKSCKVRLEYNCARYDEKLINELFKAYERILEELAVSEAENIENISILSDEERHKLVFEFNDTAVDYPRDKCVHELFTEQAQKTPDKTALVFEDKHFTYIQLDEMSNSLAHFLRGKGVRRNDVIPIIAKRSWHVIVAMLGVLKADGAYMPVSPDYPEERIKSMLEIAEVKFALLYGYEKLLPIEQIDLNVFDYFNNKEPLENQNSPEDLCYVIFTSGSTGTPKGVALCHYNVSNYCSNNDNNVCDKIVKGNYRKIVSVTNIIFDIFVTESLLPLLNGITIYFANDEEVAKQNKLSSLIKNNEIEILQTTPTKMRSYIMDKKDAGYLGCLKAIILGGEAFSPDLYYELRKYTDAEIFNIYGPAETTVWSTNTEVTDGDITIGKPIANTQIYILDKNQNLLPIGVEGELCIAGDGVGRGYLNRPELTAERFLPNPFATEENGHGKIMYRTGDLARFRTDGEIEYLGRIDTQVKIRGLRIELGEIESVMSGFPGILMSAVTDKRDENKRQYLVGYYTSELSVDERELRKYISAKLPKYMVPNYFVRLETMPMTASEKTDRKNLPLPDITLSQGEYIEPETGREKLLCHVLEELLGYERIGVEDDFFEMGGDSLKAIEYTARLQDEGVNVSLQNIFDYPTVRNLCDFLESGVTDRVKYCAEDFKKYQSLLNESKIDASFYPEKKSLGNILLTGATGFLGAHILDSLMKEETEKIYCLIRSASQSEGEERVRKILRYYFDDIYEEEIGKRIIPIVGDIERDGLAQVMPEDVRTVIHAAASVKHYGLYFYFEKVNVWGTRNVLNYAKKVGARFIHISTLSVSGNSMADDFSVYRSAEEKYFAETSFYIDQPLDNVYIRSKFEAEKAVLDAMLEGMDAKIIRIGNLTNRVSDYIFQPNYRQNAFLTRVKAVLEFGLMPDYIMELYSEFSPVDLTAEGVVKIAQYAGKQSVFHLYSNRPIYHDRLLKVLERLDINLKVVDKDTFNAALRNTIKSRDTEYIYEAFQNDMDDSGKLLYDTNIHIENEFTVWFLKMVGFEWNEIDFEYIRGYVQYFRELGFLKV